jgi:O-antigen polymerase
MKSFYKHINAVKGTAIYIMIFLYGFYILINIICKNVSMSDRVLELIGLYILYILLRSNKSVHLWNVVVISIIIGGIIQVFYGILQQCGLFASNHDIFKITGSFYNPGSYGGYLASIFPIVLGIKLYRKDLSINFRFLSYPLMRYALNITKI